MKYQLIIVFVLSLTFFSCTEQQVQAEKGNQTKATVLATKKPTASTAQNKVTKYWNALQKQTGINNSQRKNIIAVQKKYKDKIEVLKKNGNWLGEKNNKNRKNISVNTQKEIKNILGAKLYTKKVAFDKTFNKQKK